MSDAEIIADTPYTAVQMIVQGKTSVLGRIQTCMSSNLRQGLAAMAACLRVYQQGLQGS